MLQVTDAAVSVLKSAVLHEGEPSQQPDPPTAVRIRAAVMDDGRQTLTLQPVIGPEPGDEPTEATDLDVRRRDGPHRDSFAPKTLRRGSSLDLRVPGPAPL
jgi:hypothetical protein